MFGEEKSTKLQITTPDIIVRPLTDEDGPAYRILRKRILHMGDGKYFSDSYIRESHFQCDAQWRDWCTTTQEHCTIGTFHNNELIGIMGIIMYGPPEDLTAEWEVTWLDPRYRGMGMAQQSYEKVLQWTIEHGYKYAVVFIREDNLRSRTIREKQGAIYVSTKPNEVWADGSIAAAHRFSIDLSELAARKTSPYLRAMRALDSAAEPFEQEDPLLKDAV